MSTPGLYFASIFLPYARLHKTGGVVEIDAAVSPESRLTLIDLARDGAFKKPVIVSDGSAPFVARVRSAEVREPVRGFCVFNAELVRRERRR